jgi:transglutaminase-like putative cysteine protease
VIYDIRHITTYTYGSVVPFARCVLRIFPREERGQRVMHANLKLNHPASEKRDTLCFFGNRVMAIAIDQPHKALTVEIASRVEVNAQQSVGLELQAPWESVRDEALMLASLSPDAPAQFLFASRLTPLSDDATDYARPSFPPGRMILDGARDLMGRIRRDFVYDPKATVISTPLSTVLQQKRGVCQDFAHLMIAGLRGLGLPAAYVSGYLRTIPPPGKKRLEGADATHAWVSVWCGRGLGWIGLDPTNDMAAGLDHIVTARGRDYADVSPIDGVIIGAGDQSVEVKVDVIPVEVR